MSETICICGHATHIAKKCHQFGCGCENFIRNDIYQTRILGNINQVLGMALSDIMRVVSGMLDILGEVHPEAVETVRAKYEAAQAEQNKRLAEEEATRAAQEPLEEDDEPSNVIRFPAPVSTPSEPDGEGVA